MKRPPRKPRARGLRREIEELRKENEALRAALSRAGLVPAPTPSSVPSLTSPSTWGRSGAGTLSTSVPTRHPPAPPSPTGGISEATRRFIKNRLISGDSAAAARKVHNLLTGLSETDAVRRWGWSAKGIVGAQPVTAKDVHRIQSALSKKERAERRETRARMRIRAEADRRQAEVLGLPAPSTDYQRAHDAGVLYRATHEEAFHRIFEEGSP